MRLVFCLVVGIACSAFAQEATPEVSEEARLLEAAEKLVPGLPTSSDEATAAIWHLCQVASQTKDSKIHWKARTVAGKISDADPLNPRARFVYGYFRAREALSTVDPFTQKRRLHEGRRTVQDALSMGARDAHFLLDAGLLIMSLSSKVDLVQRGIDALTLSKRLLGAEFDSLTASRRADWNAGLGKGFAMLDLPELARNHYAEAAALAPQTPSGEAAREWLSARKLG